MKISSKPLCNLKCIYGKQSAIKPIFALRYYMYFITTSVDNSHFSKERRFLTEVFVLIQCTATIVSD